MSESAELELKKKTSNNKTAAAPAQQTVQRDLQDVNGPAGGMLPDDVSSKIQSMRGTGQRLSNRQLQNYSQKFGRDMSDVHIHTDTASDTISRSLNARAFTIGSDVFLTKGINPDGGGRDAETMTHELTHVVQQNGRASFGSLKLGAADTAQEHEAESTAQREYAPEFESATADTIQRGFWSSLGSAIGHNALNMFGLNSVYDAFSDFMSGDRKVKAAIEKMDAAQRNEYNAVETRIKALEGGELDNAKKQIKVKEKNLSNVVNGANRKERRERQAFGIKASSADIQQAQSEIQDAGAEYSSLKEEYQALLKKQLDLLQKVDETITVDDVSKYRSGKAKTLFSSIFAAVGGNFLAGFQSGDKAKAEARQKGISSINSWFASKNKGVADVEDQEEDKEAKAKEIKRKESELIAAVWQDVQADEKLKSYYGSWLLFKREIAKEHSELIQESIKDGESDSDIKTAILESLTRKAEGSMNTGAAPAQAATPAAATEGSKP